MSSGTRLFPLHPPIRPRRRSRDNVRQLVRLVVEAPEGIRPYYAYDGDVPEGLFVPTDMDLSLGTLVVLVLGRGDCERWISARVEWLSMASGARPPGVGLRVDPREVPRVVGILTGLGIPLRAPTSAA